jgi:cell division protein FtsB
MNINNRISYGRSIFYLENVDNIYFYTPFEIKGLDALKTFWDLSGINFEKLPIEEIDFLNRISLEYNSLHYQDEVNFSIFPRPPKFYKTKTFHLFLVIFISSLIFGGDYFYRDYTNKQLQQEIKNIKNRYNKKNRELTVLRAKNQAILEEVTKYKKQIKEIQTKIDFIRDILKASFNYLDLPKTNKDFLLLSNLLQKYKLETVLITYKENQFFIAVYTKTNKRDSISKFMNDLIYAGYKNVRTNEINNINNLYTSLIRFEK